MNLVIYDGDCGFCDRSLSFARHRLRAADAGAISCMPWQATDLRRHGLTVELANRSVWLVRPGKPHLEGARVFAYLAQRGAGAWPALGRVLNLFPISLLAAAVYRVVAANRHRLPGGSACALPRDRNTSGRLT